MVVGVVELLQPLLVVVVEVVVVAVLLLLLFRSTGAAAVVTILSTYQLCLYLKPSGLNFSKVSLLHPRIPRLFSGKILISNWSKNDVQELYFFCSD